MKGPTTVVHVGYRCPNEAPALLVLELRLCPVQFRALGGLSAPGVRLLVQTLWWMGFAPRRGQRGFICLWLYVQSVCWVVCSCVVGLCFAEREGLPKARRCLPCQKACLGPKDPQGKSVIACAYSVQTACGQIGRASCRERGCQYV